MFSKELKSLRLNKGLTQSALAQKSGVSLPTIQNIELGKANPSLQIIQKLLKALGAQFEIHLNPETVDLLGLFNMDKSEFRQNNLKSLLIQFNQKYDPQKTSGRDQDLLASLYSSLQCHYPNWLIQNDLQGPINFALKLFREK